MRRPIVMPITPEQHQAALAARVLGRTGEPLSPVSFADAARTAAEELPHQLERLNWLARHNKLHWGGVAIRAKHLKHAVAILQALAALDPTGAFISTSPQSTPDA